MAFSREAVGSGCVGTINWCEVAQKSAERGLDVAQVRTLLEEVGLVIGYREKKSGICAGADFHAGAIVLEECQLNFYALFQKYVEDSRSGMVGDFQPDDLGRVALNQ